NEPSRANRGAHSQAVGWISRQKSSRRPVEGETFFLTSLFIEPEDESHGYGKKATTNPLERIEGHTHRQWAGSRDKNLLGVRSRGNFFLDIPFYRTQRTRFYTSRL